MQRQNRKAARKLQDKGVFRVDDIVCWEHSAALTSSQPVTSLFRPRIERGSMLHRALLVTVVVTSLLFPANGQGLDVRGHAHNDYEHERPLLDALEHGFASVEADIWLRDGDLLIGHDEVDLEPSRTLQSLYLDPLRKAAPSLPGSLVLLVDIKTDGETTYSALSSALASYADILTGVEDGQVTERGIRLIVSGNRPLAMMTEESPRYAFYDGRLSDLGSQMHNSLMSLVSDNWTRHFIWAGVGEMPANERTRLTEIVEKAHSQGYQLRFWATPDQPGPARDALWHVLADAGVDYINTDDLAGFASFAP